MLLRRSCEGELCHVGRLKSPFPFISFFIKPPTTWNNYWLTFDWLTNEIKKWIDMTLTRRRGRKNGRLPYTPTYLYYYWVDPTSCNACCLAENIFSSSTTTSAKLNNWTNIYIYIYSYQPRQHSLSVTEPIFKLSLRKSPIANSYLAGSCQSACHSVHFSDFSGH